MNQEEEQLHAAIEAAFADRTMPAGRLIEDGEDLGYHLEAQDVDKYFRKYKAVINSDNEAMVAFIYMNAEASFWLLPLYMKYLLTDYQKDDLLTDIFFDVLAGKVSPYRKSPGNRDHDMRTRATDREAEVVCRFCRWLKGKDDMIGYVADHSDDAIKLWCTRA